jgi:predicted dehydrogenase
MSPSRRSFLKTTSAASAALGFPALRLNARVAPSDEVRVGVIGANGMGMSDIRSMIKVPEVVCAAMCDVDQHVLDVRSGEIEEAGGHAPDKYNDYRALLEDQSLDAVIIGTPDHWHARIMVDACEAGKDVYVEKPLANSIHEAQVMEEVARKYGRVVQTGQWQRSGQHWTDAINYLQAGNIGRVRTARAWAYMDWMPALPPHPDGPAPDTVDYDMWLGPAPSREFNQNRFHFNFRWFWDYAGGLMTDWGVHLIDIVLWGMNAEAPNSVVASGGKFAYPNDPAETPDTMQAIYEFDDFSMIWEHAVGIALGPFQRDHGVAFVGEDGTLVIDRAKWEVYPEDETVDGIRRFKTEKLPVQNRRDSGGLDEHTANFVDCMRTRARPNADVAIGRAAPVTSHLGNVAYRTGGKVEWDAAARRFIGNDEANRYLKPDYRSPWNLPSA